MPECIHTHDAMLQVMRCSMCYGGTLSKGSVSVKQVVKTDSTTAKASASVISRTHCIDFDARSFTHFWKKKDVTK